MSVVHRLRESNRLGVVRIDEADETSRGEAFLTLFLKAERRLFAYILTLLPNRTDAQDVLQDVSMIMWQKFDERNPPGDFTAWGCRIAYFRIQHHRRHQQRQRVRFSERLLEQLSDTLAEEMTGSRTDERLDALDRCLGKLGQADRALLTERMTEGATAQSTAGAFGCSVDTVYKSMARIRKALFECMTRALNAEHRS